jgi:hypothetical protein
MAIGTIESSRVLLFLAHNFLDINGAPTFLSRLFFLELLNFPSNSNILNFFIPHGFSNGPELLEQAGIRWILTFFQFLNYLINLG